MAVDTEQSEHVERKGLSRRDMIRASAIAGAAAWTAPVIIDSLSSPAAAGSQCHKYYVKFQPNGTCFNANPLCSLSRDANTCSLCPSTGSAPNNPKPVLLPPGTGACATANPPTCSGFANYYKVVLDSTSKFSASTLLNFSVAGNYTTCHTGGGCTTLAPGSGTPSGNGYFSNNGTTAYLVNKITVSDHDYSLCYVYLQFCSTTAKSIGSGGNCTDCSPLSNCGT